MLAFLNADQAELHEIIEAFAARYPNRKTAQQLRLVTLELFRQSGHSHPAQLTEADLLTWATHGDPANNTVYNRMSKARTFLKWCQQNNYTDHNVSDHLSDFQSPLRTYRRTYGKVQDKNPGRWLTHEEAYGTLIAQCQDGSEIGLRDEIAIELGLMGMRASEITNLTLQNLRQLPVITWTGKGRKPRQATAGASLVAALEVYLTLYREHVQVQESALLRDTATAHSSIPSSGERQDTVQLTSTNTDSAQLLLRPDKSNSKRPLSISPVGAGTITPTLPLLCPQMRGGQRHGRQPRLNWGTKMPYTTLWELISKRATAAGLGHVAPHDLRRTAAGILHRATDEHGAHHFDLLDIQKVLGHSDPATTMRSYLEPMQTDVLDRAALFLTSDGAPAATKSAE